MHGSRRARRGAPAVSLLALAAAGCSLFGGDSDEDPGNLLVNGSFEIWSGGGPAGWEVVQKGQNERLEPEGAPAHGKTAVGITCLHPAEFIMLRQLVAVKPGFYRARVAVRPILPLRESYLVVECLDAEGKRLDVRMREIRGQTSEWRPVVCDIRAPAGAAAIRVDIRIGPNAAGQVALDAARLELLKAAP